MLTVLTDTRGCQSGVQGVVPGATPCVFWPLEAFWSAAPRQGGPDARTVLRGAPREIGGPNGSARRNVDEAVPEDVSEGRRSCAECELCRYADAWRHPYVRFAMVCFSPLQGWRAKDGSRKLVFNRQAGFSDLPVSICCGQCAGCRLERSRQWAVRCLHESKLHSSNCYVTLTYSDNFLPANRSLVIKDYQDFMKRLRKRYGSGIKYFHCGEYGERTFRPHYHACIFGMDFDDRKFLHLNNNGDKVFTSKKLDEIWSMGACTVGDVTFKSAAYVARYVMKKVTGPSARDHYEYVCPDSGEVFDRCPEYITMSRRPGIAKGHFDKFMDDIYPSDMTVVDGVPTRPPRYYDKLLEAVDPKGLERLKAKRVRNAKKHSDNNTPDRLKVRAELCSLKLRRLKRNGVV